MILKIATAIYKRALLCVAFFAYLTIKEQHLQMTLSSHNLIWDNQEVRVF